MGCADATWVAVRGVCAACCVAAIALALRAGGAPPCAPPEGEAPERLATSWGIALALGAACVNAGGLHLQKQAHARLSEPAAYFDDSGWWAGFALILLSEALMGASYGFAPAVVVSPLGSIVVVASTALAVLRLGERVGAARAASSALTIAGSVVVTVGAPEAHRTLTDAQIARRLLLATPSLGLAAASAVGIAVLASWSPAGDGAALVRLATYAALVSSWTVVGVRGVVSLLARAPADCAACACAGTVASPVLWLLLAVIVLTAYWAGGVVEQRGIARFEQSVWVPVHFCACAILFGAVSAGAYGDRLEEPTPLLAGTALCVIGVLGHAASPPPAPSPGSSQSRTRPGSARARRRAGGGAG